MNAPQCFGFTWPNAQQPPIQPPPSVPADLTIFQSMTVDIPLPRIHPGIVVMTFCDGHTDSVPEDTLCSAYLAAP